MAEINPSIDYTWSSEADGAFLELSLSSPQHFQNIPIVIEPHVLQAFDFGYVTSEYDGPNNLQVGVTAMININDSVQLNLNLNHSWAQENIDRENKGDVTWFGINVNGRI